jgi:hypothetical protein
MHKSGMGTDAENKARLDGMYRAEDMGNSITKIWMATLDNRTRDSHAKLDGAEITLDDAATDWASVTFVEQLQDYFIAGDNVLAIEVQNFTSAAALLFDGYVETVSGGWIDFYSDTTILCSKEEVDGWTE